jgi:hypothetical protein
MMLTSLDFLTPGASWPPPGEKTRIDRYMENERLFLTQHSEVWEEKFNNLAARLKKKQRLADTPINYHQLISKKTADFVCGEPPKIETEGDTDKLLRVLNKQNFFAKLYEGIIDVSKCGNAVIKLVGKEATAVSPLCWYPVVDPTNIKSILYHVIAYPTDFDKDGKPTKLYVEIHSDSWMEVRWYTFEPGQSTLGAQVMAPVKSELPEKAIHVLSNMTFSGSIYGMDDYNIVNPIIQKVMWRLHCADTILDKHSEPSVSGPESALQYDEQTGKWFVPLGNYFKRASADDPALEYVTWDGNLDSNFKEIETLINQLYILSEMGQAFADAGGGDSSGTALKLRMVSPRMKAQRIAGINAAAVKELIAAIARLNGIKIDYDTLTVHWCDGLPVDEKELLETLAAATGGKPVMSQYSAMIKRGLTDDEAKEEIEQIRDEDAYEAPMTNVDRPAGSDGDKPDDGTEAGDDE